MPLARGKVMRNFLLGAVLCAALGLPAYGADTISGPETAAVKRPGMRLVCHRVPGDRALRLLSYTPVAIVKKSIKTPDVNATVAAPTATESVRVLRWSNERIALVIGVGF